MKAIVSSDGRVSFEIEGDNEADIFKNIARIHEVFDHGFCGKCGCGDTKFVCRLDKEENDWLEVVCQDPKCRAKIIFGRTKKGGQIYPKVKWEQLSDKQQEQRASEKEYADKHYGYLPNKGWFVYQRD